MDYLIGGCYGDKFKWFILWYIGCSSDVIGYVTSIGSLEEYRINGETKSRIRFTLVDEEGLSVNFVLYDECALNVCLTDLSKLEAPVVMILQLARVGFDDDGTLSESLGLDLGMKVDVSSIFVFMMIYAVGSLGE